MNSMDEIEFEMRMLEISLQAIRERLGKWRMHDVWVAIRDLEKKQNHILNLVNAEEMHRNNQMVEESK